MGKCDKNVISYMGQYMLVLDCARFYMFITSQFAGNFNKIVIVLSLSCKWYDSYLAKLITFVVDTSKLCQLNNRDGIGILWIGNIND